MLQVTARSVVACVVPPSNDAPNSPNDLNSALFLHLGLCRVCGGLGGHRPHFWDNRLVSAGLEDVSFTLPLE